MVDATRALLDELMGRDRDVPIAQRSSKKIDFRDEGVCKYALVACCPHQLFVNTKSALGESDAVAMRASWLPSACA